MSCPSCGGRIRAGASVCGRCGFDRGLGRRPLGAEPRRPAKPARALVVAAFVAGCVAALVVPLLVIRRAPSPEPRVEPPVSADALEGAVPPPGAVPEPAAPQPAAQAPDPRADEIRSKLDRNRPLHEPGESVEVRTRVGQIKRGILVARFSDRIVVQAGEGVADTVPFSDMDVPTRVQFDPAYRERYIEYRTRQTAEDAGGL
jgi:hypothetical protein